MCAQPQLTRNAPTQTIEQAIQLAGQLNGSRAKSMKAQSLDFARNHVDRNDHVVATTVGVEINEVGINVVAIDINVDRKAGIFDGIIVDGRCWLSVDLRCTTTSQPIDRAHIAKRTGAAMRSASKSRSSGPSACM